LDEAAGRKKKSRKGPTSKEKREDEPFALICQGRRVEMSRVKSTRILNKQQLIIKRYVPVGKSEGKETRAGFSKL